MSGMRAQLGAGDDFGGRSRAFPGLFSGMKMKGTWLAIGRRPHIIDPKTGRNLDHILDEPDWKTIVEKHALRIEREELFRDEWENIVVNQGLNHMLDVHFSAATQVTTWYLALLQASPTPAAGSTYQNFMGTGNSEFTAYDEANRQTWVEAGPSAQSITNSASPATFTIDTDSSTIGGAALVTDNTKNDNGAGPFMYAAGAFSAGNKGLDDNDTLDVTATFTAADDGA